MKKWIRGKSPSQGRDIADVEGGTLHTLYSKGKLRDHIIKVIIATKTDRNVMI